MSSFSSIHEILDKDDWNYDEIVTFLKQDASSINKVDCSGCYPLLRLLASEKCSFDLVALFLQYGADINFMMNSCLNTLFFYMCNRGKDVCRIFWEKVIDSNMYHKYFDDRSPLCVFLNTDMQPEVIKLVLLNTDRSLNVCKKHVSSFHCAMMNPNTKHKTEMLRILIEAGHVFGMHLRDAQGQSFLCYALSQGAGQEVIKLFLEAGCPLKACKKHVSALHCTMYSKNLQSKENVYAILLEAGLGSYMNRLDSNGRSFLCNAMRLGTELGAIKIFLIKGCRLNSCKKHASELHCVTRLQDSKYKVDVCRLLIEAYALAGLDLNKLDLYGRTPICNVLQHGAEPEVFNLFLNAGCLLDACRGHDYHPLFCATKHSGVLRADTLRLVINAYAPLEDRNIEYNYLGEGPMRCALQKCIYETEAIKLLYEFEREGFHTGTGETFLHVAVKNPQCCKPDAVQFLIDQGDYVCAQDNFGRNSLYLAIENNCQSDVIKVLLNNSNMDCCLNHDNTNPLHLAFNMSKDADYLEVMLKAGVPITSIKGSDLMLSALLRYFMNQCPENINVCKLLLKYIYLENSQFKITSLTCRRKCYKVFVDFAKECVREKEIMESNNIGNQYTLYEFIRKPSAKEMLETQHNKRRKKGKTSKKYDLNQLLKILADNCCHLYSDVISAKICREDVKTKLTNMSIYTTKDCSDHSGIAKRIVLNRDCVAKIATFLSDDELFRMVLAFFPVNQIPSTTSKKEKKHLKRKSGEPVRHSKRKRRCL